MLWLLLLFCNGSWICGLRWLAGYFGAGSGFVGLGAGLAYCGDWTLS